MPVVRVALDVPLYRTFDYLADDATAADVGCRVKVSFGRGRKVGIVVAVREDSELPRHQLKPVDGILRDLPGLPADWFRLCEFASAYYQAPLGEVMLQTLPTALRRTDPPKARTIKPKAAKAATVPALPALTADQQAALDALRAAPPGFAGWLLHGITGSGKTEVYLRLIADTLAAGRQALLLVPEINLTPQLEARIAARFPGVPLVSLHSELTEAARLRHWKAAFEGGARIVVGTRLAVFTPMPELGLIVVDEEHDPSFKQQDGMRYSARDVAVLRARLLGIPVLLGSATPSLESWANAQPGPQQRYRLLTLAERAVAGARLPDIRLVDTRRETLDDGLSPALIAALEARLARGEQSLVFLNRRGYAPVLACPSCGWVSRCKRCAANLVLHLKDRRLRCHHCGLEAGIPRACPSCGNQDIYPFGRGTQRLEERLQARFPEARILRVDRDAARSRKQWEALLDQIHPDEAAGTPRADILVGTQMLAKGHDFPHLTFVGVVGADSGLFAADFRAPERLFAMLMQVAGRAGRAELAGEVLIQTEQPGHPLFAALLAHDYPAFAARELEERRQAGFPPYTYQAMLRAEAPDMADSLAFLKAAKALPILAAHPAVFAYDPVPMRMARLANLERGQLLFECGARPALQAFLADFTPALAALPAPGRLRWHLEVDPLEC